MAPKDELSEERRRIIAACLSAYEGVGGWDKCEVLGRGAYGVVWRGELHSTRESIAVKQINTDGMGETELMVGCHAAYQLVEAVREASTALRVLLACLNLHQAVENEIRMIRQLKHKNVVTYLGVEVMDHHLASHLNIFLKFVDGGSLRRILHDHGPMTEEHTAFNTQQVPFQLVNMYPFVSSQACRRGTSCVGVLKCPAEGCYCSDTCGDLT